MAGTKKQSNGVIGPMTLVSWNMRKKNIMYKNRYIERESNVKSDNHIRV